MQTWGLRLSCRSLYPFALIPFAQVAREARAGMKVLDVPAGGGVLSCALKAAGFDVTAADLFPEYLGKGLAKYSQGTARTLFEAMTGATLPEWLARDMFGPSGDVAAERDVRCVGADMEARLPFEDGTFDRVACLEGIEHVVDRHRTLRELRRVLKPGGKLLITTPNLMSLRARLAFAFAGQRAFKSYVDEHTSVWGVSPVSPAGGEVGEGGGRIYHGHAFLLTYFQLRYSLYHCGLRITRLLPSNASVSSVLLSPMALGVWAGTAVSQRRAKKKFERLKRGDDGFTYKPPAGTEAPYGEMMGHLMSANLLMNATMVVEAEVR